MQSLFDTVEAGLYWFGSFFLEADVDALCRLRSALNDNTLTTTDDDLLSVVRISGSKHLVGVHEAELMSERLSAALSVPLRSGNGRLHGFSVGFRSNPQGAAALLRSCFEPMIATLHRYSGHNVPCDLFDDRVAALSRVCAQESVYLVTHTRRQGLSPNDLKRLREAAIKSGAYLAKETPGLRTGDEFAQEPKFLAAALVPRHEAMIGNLLETLNRSLDANGVGLVAELLPVHEAVTQLRAHMGADVVPPGWRPKLMGDATAGLRTHHRRDASSWFPMRIGRQMVTGGFKEEFHDIESCARAGVHYGSVVLEQMPAEGSELFADLSRRVGRQIPWVLSVEVLPEGLSVRRMDQFFVGFLGGFGEHNKRVRRAWSELRRIAGDGQAVVAVRAVFTTWADSRDACVDNLSFLRSCLESWGSAIVTNETGAPAMAALASCAGFTAQSPAPYVPAPMADLARMLPMLRPASIWDNGHLVARTSEGRPYPVKFGTTEQDFWGTGIFAPSGRGKSFLMNMINFGVVFAPGQKDLPYVTVIDVGPSSRLVMDLARSMLPPQLAQQVVSLRIRNEQSYAINPFDTQLGVDRPTAADLDFLSVVVETIAPALGQDGPRLIGMVLRKAYEMRRRESPESAMWQPAFDTAVERARQEAGIAFEPGRTRVWDLVDAFFERGDVHMAISAQRFAVPKLPDLVQAANDKEIANLYANAVTPAGESLLTAFVRAIITAIAEYQLIAGVTRFDVGSARCISIDLEEVVSSQSEEGRRRAALMYMFARRLGAKNYWLRWEDELKPLTPAQYHSYHAERVLGMQEALKFLEYDEVHNASGIAAMQRLLQKDLREGRKYNVVTVMTSQLLDDFPPAAVENCYNFFILGVGSENSAKRLRETFSLSESELLAIERECIGPGRLFALFKTRRGTISQILHTTAGGFERWAFNTDAVDAAVRRELIDRLGGTTLEALRLLSRVYPEGSARKLIDARRVAAGSHESADATQGYVAQVVDELAQQHLDSVRAPDKAVAAMA